MAAEQELRERFQATIRAEFQNNAFLLIDKMVKMAVRTQGNAELVDEILHSIFFLGEISCPKISPREIFGDDFEMFNRLKNAYPEPFRLYSSRLPRRSPFSCVLDMVVHLRGQENENDIIETLQNLIGTLMRNTRNPRLSSATICISAGNSTDSVKHYGVSMSGGPARQILIAAACLHFWEEHVAGAVMSYYPARHRKTYFDVAIELPAGVRCEAFDLRSREVKIPCLSCHNMFHLDTTDIYGFPYGNCAEAESLSNLLKERTVQVGRIGNWEQRRRAEDAVRNHLKNQLRQVGFAWDNQFYTPH